MITKHDTVMHKDPERFDERREEIWFTNAETEEQSDLFEDFMMDWDVWTRMGRPEKVTLSVVPGDTLNSAGVGQPEL